MWILLHHPQFSCEYSFGIPTRPQQVICPKLIWLLQWTAYFSDYSTEISLMQWRGKAWKAIPHDVCGMWPFCLLSFGGRFGACSFYIYCWWSSEFGGGRDKSTCTAHVNFLWSFQSVFLFCLLKAMITAGCSCTPLHQSVARWTCPSCHWSRRPGTTFSNNKYVMLFLD